MANNTLSDSYIKKVKALFPYIGKAEKSYLDNLKLTVDDYCSEETINTLKELEDGFGKAEDVVHEYVSSVETEELVRRLNTRKLIKRIGVVLLIVILAVSIGFSLYTYRKYQLIKETALFFEDVTIE